VQAERERDAEERGEVLDEARPAPRHREEEAGGEHRRQPGRVEVSALPVEHARGAGSDRE
jgi:hypothetical protein